MSKIRRKELFLSLVTIASEAKIKAFSMKISGSMCFALFGTHFQLGARTMPELFRLHTCDVSTDNSSCSTSNCKMPAKRIILPFPQSREEPSCMCLRDMQWVVCGPGLGKGSRRRSAKKIVPGQPLVAGVGTTMYAEMDPSYPRNPGNNLRVGVYLISIKRCFFFLK